METWYAAHLMYFLFPTETIPTGVADGCLVISLTTSGSPGNLGWPTGQGPAQCGSNGSVEFPAGNYPLYFQTLSGLANNGSCSTWGEPAVMAMSGRLYLAADCFDSRFISLGYYIFYTTSITTSAPPVYTTWQYQSGPFGIGTGAGELPSSAYPASSGVNSITELDWALRPDQQTIVAVVTPASVVGDGNTKPPMQFGCVALSFSLTTGFSSSVLAKLSDNTTSGSLSESRGPNGCTFEPTSNTGVVVVRNLVDNADDPVSQTYTLVDTGVLP
jgi:hypothetical protein